MRPALQRMHSRVLAHLGEDAVLIRAPGDEVTCRIVIERGVTVQYATGDDKFHQSEMAMVVDVANIKSDLNPRPGMQVTIGATTRGIDALLADNGVNARCILV